MNTKSYLAIEVPIYKNARWLRDLRGHLTKVNVHWQEGGYHITMAFLNEASEEQQAKAKEIIGNRLKGVARMPMTFDALDVFTASSGEAHIVNMTSTNPNRTFMALTDTIRQDLSKAGLRLATDFKLHVTLGRVPAKSISLNDLERRLSVFRCPVFTLNLDSLKYLVYHGETIGTWNLQK